MHSFLPSLCLSVLGRSPPWHHRNRETRHRNRQFTSTFPQLSPAVLARGSELAVDIPRGTQVTSCSSGMARSIIYRDAYISQIFSTEYGQRSILNSQRRKPVLSYLRGFHFRERPTHL